MKRKPDTKSKKGSSRKVRIVVQNSDVPTNIEPHMNVRFDKRGRMSVKLSTVPGNTGTSPRKMSSPPKVSSDFARCLEENEEAGGMIDDEWGGILGVETEEANRRQVQQVSIMHSTQHSVLRMSTTGRISPAMAGLRQ